MKRYLATAIFVLISCVSYAQNTKGYSRFYFSYSRQNYWDKNSISYDGLGPANHIDPRNTNAGSWAIAYEKVWRSGLLLSAELRYAIRKYEMSIGQDITRFDDEAGCSSGKYICSLGTFGARTKSWTPCFFIGYRTSIAKKWKVTAKIGLSEKLFFERVASTSMDAYHFKHYAHDGTSEYIPVEITIDYRLGRSMSPRHNYKSPATLPTYECYIGIDRDINAHMLKSISFGVEASRGLWMWGRHQAIVVSSTSPISNFVPDKDVFIDRNISMGIRIAVGFWR